MRRLVSLLICYKNTRVTNLESRYTASAQLVPRKHRAIVGWVVGWLNILGQIAGLSSTEFGLANMIWAAVVVGKVSILNFWVLSRYVYAMIPGRKLHHHPWQDCRPLRGTSCAPRRLGKGISSELQSVNSHGRQNCLATRQLARLTSGFVFVNLGATISKFTHCKNS